MLKELRDNDIDNIMKLWKNEYSKSNKFLKGEVLVNIYTKVRNKFIKNLTSTVIYTEDGKIEGFISVDENNEIWAMLVIPNIRREGIGTILLENSKKQYKKLTAKVPKNNEIALMFFYKNGFKKVNKVIEDSTKENKYVLEWKKEEKKNINLIYFDEDIDKRLINKESKINFKCLNVKQFFKKENIQDIEINNIKTYIKLRKKIEEVLEGERILLYIDYNNYYNFLDEQIKEVAKIKKIELQIIVCDPFTIEGIKKVNIIKQIEETYKDYKVNKIDCSLDINQDISLNQIFIKRNEILLQKIEAITENM
ncbi:MAG: GNAT family N-acetyltransferase [Clostridia bacterium]|nr:GNAT family N-acetyltransferase [Clostridia bacterium]